MSYEPDFAGQLSYGRNGGKGPVGHYSNLAGYSANKDPRINGNVGTKIDVADDQPLDRHELFLLEEGEKKVEFEPETREHTSLNTTRAMGKLTPSPRQACPTQRCSPSIRRTTRSAICCVRSS